MLSLEELKEKLREYVKYTPSQLYYDEEKSKIYYSYLKQYQTLRREIERQRAPVQIEQSEETQPRQERYITCQNYENALRRTEKAVLRNMGY